ncbi:MAG: type II secretion system protein [Candidatus Saccharibacteria bacterium]|nr:type II secretion system protein [Candidatus Saccharibacteria bacterium]
MTKTVKKGFTIVELLIVIVVIGILAAIVLVTYQGVQNKANTTSAEQNARELVTKATAFNAVATVYPTEAELKAAKTDANEDVKEAKLSEKVAALLDNTNLPAGDNATNKKRVSYKVCKETGNNSRVGAVGIYWNYSDGKLAYVTGGETKGTDCDALKSAIDAGTAPTWP